MKQILIGKGIKEEEEEEEEGKGKERDKKDVKQ